MVDIMCWKAEPETIIEEAVVVAPKHCKSSSVSVNDARFVGMHMAICLPRTDENCSEYRKQCKFFDCGARTRTLCRKCGIYLCNDVSGLGSELSHFEQYNNYFSYVHDT